MSANVIWGKNMKGDEKKGQMLEKRKKGERKRKKGDKEKLKKGKGVKLMQNMEE
jgi:hypothetical protein